VGNLLTTVATAVTTACNGRQPENLAGMHDHTEPQQLARWGAQPGQMAPVRSGPQPAPAERRRPSRLPGNVSPDRSCGPWHASGRRFDRPCRARPTDPVPGRGGSEHRRRPRPNGTGAEPLTACPRDSPTQTEQGGTVTRRERRRTSYVALYGGRWTLRNDAP
jgi:hypothetical protein